MSTARWIASSLILCGLLVLAWYSVLLARADSSFRDNNLMALRTAVRLVPANAAYHALLAEHLEAAGANPDAELETATNLSPHESRYWIRRAFRAELEQKFDESERYLLVASRVDRGFDPRWALMNYYFRRGRLPQFWKSTREALDTSYGNLDPIFRLCLAASDDPTVIRQALPPRRDILFAFFSYLTAHERVESAAGMATELASSAQPDEVEALLDYSGKANCSSREVESDGMECIVCPASHSFCRTIPGARPDRDKRGLYRPAVTERIRLEIRNRPWSCRWSSGRCAGLGD